MYAGLFLSEDAGIQKILKDKAAAAVSFPPHRGRDAGAAGTHPRPPYLVAIIDHRPSTAPTTAA